VILCYGRGRQLAGCREDMLVVPPQKHIAYIADTVLVYVPATAVKDGCRINSLADHGRTGFIRQQYELT